MLMLVTGCATTKHSQDPYRKVNRKVFAFNQKVDKAVARPIARGYEKITTPTARKLIGNFYSNIHLPISIVNDVLQLQLGGASRDTGRLAVNTTIGLLGFFDPASELGLTEDKTDFGVTLARWGLAQGPYLVLPLLGPTTARDLWSWPVDSYLLDPMSWYARNHSLRYHTEYLPVVLYYVQLRASLLSADDFLDSAYDPYLAMRNAYLQRRTYLIYHGNPPTSVIERMQGFDGSSSNDIEQLLQQQQAYEKAHAGTGTAPAPATSTPATASSTHLPRPSAN